MRKPNNKTIFLPLSKLSKYSDKTKYFCSGVVFSPETENDHFEGCPPYIEINTTNGYGEPIFFEVPEIVAYYAKTHPGYTMRGIDNHIKQGRRDLANDFKKLLNL